MLPLLQLQRLRLLLLLAADLPLRLVSAWPMVTLALPWVALCSSTSW